MSALDARPAVSDSFEASWPIARRCSKRLRDLAAALSPGIHEAMGLPSQPLADPGSDPLGVSMTLMRPTGEVRFIVGRHEAKLSWLPGSGPLDRTAVIDVRPKGFGTIARSLSPTEASREDHRAETILMLETVVAAADVPETPIPPGDGAAFTLAQIVLAADRLDRTSMRSRAVHPRALLVALMHAQRVSPSLGHEPDYVAVTPRSPISTLTSIDDEDGSVEHGDEEPGPPAEVVVTTLEATAGMAADQPRVTIRMTVRPSFHEVELADLGAVERMRILARIEE